jgi:hypothetical protein
VVALSKESGSSLTLNELFTLLHKGKKEKRKKDESLG